MDTSGQTRVTSPLRALLSEQFARVDPDLGGLERSRSVALRADEGLDDSGERDRFADAVGLGEGSGRRSERPLSHGHPASVGPTPTWVHRTRTTKVAQSRAVQSLLGADRRISDSRRRGQVALQESADGPSVCASIGTSRRDGDH